MIKSSVIEMESKEKELETTNFKNEELINKIEYLEAEIQQDSDINK